MGVTGAIGFAALAYMDTEADKSSAKFSQAVGDANARLSEVQAEETIEAGKQESLGYKRKINQLIGSQKSAFAGQGVDVNSGIALDLEKETREFAAEDVATISNNAYLSAMGFRTQAMNYRAEGLARVNNANERQASSIATSGLQGYTSMSKKAV